MTFVSEFDSFFGPVDPPGPTGDERRHEELLHAIRGLATAVMMQSQQVESLIQVVPTLVPAVPETDLSPVVESVKGLGERFGQIPLHEPVAYPNPEAIADALAARLPDSSGALIDLLTQMGEQLRRMNTKLRAGLSGLPSGGSTDGATETTLRQMDTYIEEIRTLTRDTLFRRTDPLPAGSNILGFVSPTPIKKIQEGKGWYGGGEVTTTISNPTAYFSIHNPAGSGKNVVVIQFAVYINDTAGGRIRFMDGPTTVNTLVDSFNPNHYYEDAAGTSTGQVRVGASDFGGVEESPYARTVRDKPYEFEGAAILGPGHSVGIKVTGAATGSVVGCSVGFYEEAVA